MVDLKPFAHLATKAGLVLVIGLGTPATPASGFDEELPLTKNVPIPEFQNKAETPSYDYNAPPRGIFHEIELAEGFEEELGFRRTHEIVPVGSTETFTAGTRPVYVVFKLFQHYESFQAIARCYPERVDGLSPKTLLAEDAMYLALEDESGYLKLLSPKGGWKPGTYKVEIHIGWEVNAISQVGTMRFSVVSPEQVTTHPSPATPGESVR